MTTINERIDQVIRSLGMNKNSFSVKMGLTNSTIIGNIVSGRKNKPSFDVLSKVASTYNIDGNWLITGEGSMFNSKKTDKSSKKKEQCSECEHKQEVIELQRLRIEGLNQLVNAKDEIITELRRNLEGDCKGNLADSA